VILGLRLPFSGLFRIFRAERGRTSCKQIYRENLDLIYTITARVAGFDRNGALKRFAKLWPTLKKSLLSFRLGERLNPAKID